MRLGPYRLAMVCPVFSIPQSVEKSVSFGVAVIVIL